MRLIAMLFNIFRPDPNKGNVSPPEVGLRDAKVRNSLAADNLRETLTAMLDESNRLAFRPVYMVERSTDQEH